MKALALKFLIFFSVLLSLQTTVAALYPPALPEEILKLDQQLDQGLDLIYLGDSTLTYPVGEVTTAEILQEQLPEYSVGEIAHPAYNFDLYRYYADYIVREDTPVEAAIIPINMRSFSPEWDLRPNYQFEREKTVLTFGPLLSRILYRPLDTLGGFNPAISNDTFLAATVFNGEKAVGRVADFEELIGNTSAAQNADLEFAYYVNVPSEEEVEALSGLLTYYYMYNLSPEHRKLHSMLATGRLLKNNGIEPIFYITPINYELGERYLGEEFRQQVADNVALVEETLRQENIEPLNLVFDLEAYNFIDTEHLTENGKSYVAGELADIIEPDEPTYAASRNPKDGGPRRAVVVGPTLPASERPVLEAQPTASPPSRRPAGQAETAVEPTPALTPTRPANLTQSPGAEVQGEPTAEPTPAGAASPTAPQPTPTSTRVIPSGGLSAGSEPGDVTAVEFIRSYQPAGNYNVDLYRLRYQTYDRQDRPVEVRANVYLPRPAKAESFPVVVYGGGTTGLEANCAPLDELARGGNWGSYHYHMLEYAAQGFITVWPEWQGFEEGGEIHPYFLAEPQGRTMLDSARAVYRFFDEPQAAHLAAGPAEAVFFGGYSSGGHAAFAAKDLAAEYAPELPVKGIFGHGPTTDPTTLLSESPIFSPYLVYAYRTLLGDDVIAPSQVFQDRWLANFEADATSRCVDNIFVYYSFSGRQMYRPEFREALAADRLQNIWPAFKRALEANSAGLAASGTDIPVLILQGTADTVVTPGSQEAFAAELCRLGHDVTFNIYRAVSHADTRRVSFWDTLAWLRSVAQNESVESDCATLTAP